MRRTWLAGGMALVASVGALVAACGSSEGEGSIFVEDAGPDGIGPMPTDDTGTGPTFGDSSVNEGGNGACVPKTCVQLGATCGPQGDGCGGLIQCGDCVAPETCGGGGKQSQCGGNSGCVKKTCQSLGVNCGIQGDGCGGQIDCGTCTAPEICGGGGKPSVCGAGVGSSDAGTCTPTKTTCAPGECGPISDGCGGVLNCGGCTSPAICGGGGTPSVCGGGTLPDGGPVCTPKTCAQVGANCGPIGDGCGGLIASCGSCSNGQICGGGGTPSVCGGSTTSDAGTCTGLCLKQVNCDGGATTTFTGKVVTPRACANATCTTKNAQGLLTDADPIYNALVYVPNGTVQPFTTGVSCDQCGGAGNASGSPLVSANTSPDGTFTISNMPVGTNIPLVVQLGRWRRQFTVNVSSACGTNSGGVFHLPKNKSEGDIPLMALSTGNVDTLECLLRKIGIDDAEFTNPSDTGRVHMYVGNGGQINNQTPSDTTLYGSATELDKHDLVLFPCWGGEYRKTTAQKQNIIDYTHAGGRVFATHYSYVWLFGGVPNSSTLAPTEFTPTANWSYNGLADPNLNSVPPDPLPAFIDTSFTKGVAFSQWLGLTGGLNYSTTPPMISINVPRDDVDSVPGPPTSQRWVYSSNASPTNNSCGSSQTNAGCPSTVQHYTFNTPVGATNQCGRVVFSDFHVTGGKSTGTFPTYCGGNVGNQYNRSAALSPQEKVLEFMLFDLASCIQPDNPPPPPTCTPLTCQQQNIACGPAGDGCGGLIASCGSCSGSQTCGGGGVPGQCGGPTCTPKTCQQLGYNCGMAGDGCGGVLDCGTCQTNQACGGGGSANVCGTASCTPITCAAQNIACGPAGDGCGNVLDCGTCTAPDTCGGGGTPGQCGHPTCTPVTCQQMGAACGPIADGCGGILQCGDCTAPQTCGGGGIANQCGGGIK